MPKESIKRRAARFSEAGGADGSLSHGLESAILTLSQQSYGAKNFMPAANPKRNVLICQQCAEKLCLRPVQKGFGFVARVRKMITTKFHIHDCPRGVKRKDAREAFSLLCSITDRVQYQWERCCARKLLLLRCTPLTDGYRRPHCY